MWHLVSSSEMLCIVDLCPLKNCPYEQSSWSRSKLHGKVVMSSVDAVNCKQVLSQAALKGKTLGADFTRTARIVNDSVH